MRISMTRKTSVTPGDRFANFVQNKVADGRFETTGDAVRAGLGLLEENEARLDLLRQKLAVAQQQLDCGDSIDGEAFIGELLA